MYLKHALNCCKIDTKLIQNESQNGVLAQAALLNDFLKDLGRPFELSFPIFDLRSATLDLSCPPFGLRLALVSDLLSPFGDTCIPICCVPSKQHPKYSQIYIKVDFKGINHRMLSKLEKTRMLQTKTLKWTSRPRPNPKIGVRI